MILDEVIARLDNGGSGREFDWAIAEALGEVPAHRILPVGFDYDWYRSSATEYALWKAMDAEGRSVKLWQPKERTTSLDAAVSAVPDGYEWLFKSPGVASVYRVLEDQKEWAVHFDGKGANPAASLTIATLKAMGAIS